MGQAHDAASRREWDQAYELFMQADACSRLGIADLSVLANVAYAAGHIDVTLSAWERAYGLSVQEGGQLEAAGAAVRVALHLLFDTALMAPVRAWVKRAERLLEDLDETPVHAWLAVVPELRTAAFRRLPECPRLGATGHRHRCKARSGRCCHGSRSGGAQPHSRRQRLARAGAAERSGARHGLRRARSAPHRRCLL